VLARMAAAAEPSDRTTASPDRILVATICSGIFLQIARRQMCLHQSAEAVRPPKKIPSERKPDQRPLSDGKHVAHCREAVYAYLTSTLRSAVAIFRSLWLPFRARSLAHLTAAFRTERQGR
jgi:SMC interacting uncharacterized protein involved in chromosome segregation